MEAGALEDLALGRLAITHDDGTVSVWRRDRLGQVVRVWDHTRVFMCLAEEAGGLDEESAPTS